MKARRWLVALALVLSGCLLAPLVFAGEMDAYQQGVAMAARGEVSRAAAWLAGAAAALPADDPRRARMAAAAILLNMRAREATVPPPLPGMHDALARRWLARHPAPRPASPWLAGLFSALLPGAGHAWLGRWHDAATAAAMTLPMLGLTLWAWRRRMGPVTAFFAAITAWLWSGVVFSAVSLAHRGDAEAYARWWRELWRAAGLPGSP